MSAKHPPRPRYRFCWECSRQLQGNAHRIVVIEGHEAIVHADCADEMQSAGRIDGEIKKPDPRP